MKPVNMPCVANNFDDNLQVPNNHIRVDSEVFDIIVPGGDEDPILSLKNGGGGGGEVIEDSEVLEVMTEAGLITPASVDGNDLFIIDNKIVLL